MTHPVSIWIKALLISALAQFAPTTGILIALFALVSLDLVTGLMRAHTLGEKIQSNGLRRTVIKLVAYELSVVLAYLVETWLIGKTIPLTNMAAGAAGLVELLSVLENINVLSGGALRPLLDKLAPEIKKATKPADAPEHSDVPPADKR